MEAEKGDLSAPTCSEGAADRETGAILIQKTGKKKNSPKVASWVEERVRTESKLSRRENQRKKAPAKLNEISDYRYLVGTPDCL